MTSYPNILPGDVIYRVKDGLFDHPALVMSPFHIYENTPEQGEHLSLLSDYLAKAKGQIRVVSCKYFQRAQRVQRAHMELCTPRKWSLFSNNCQDSISRITDGEPISVQRNALVLSAISIGLVMLFRNAA